MISRRFLTGLAVAGLAGLAGATIPSLAHAQAPVTIEGDGQQHGAEVGLIVSRQMQPGQVETINLHPRRHLILELPYPVASVDVGDPDIVAAEQLGTSLKLKGIKLEPPIETDMTITLADANTTKLHFLVRVDSMAPIVKQISYTDPVAIEIQRTADRIEQRLERETAQRVVTLAEARLQQRLLLASDPVRIGREGATEARGGKMTLRIETAQQIPGEDGVPRLYLRYRLLNETLAPIDDLQFQVVAVRPAGSFVGRTTTAPLYDVQDVRSAATVPGGSAVVGLLIMETPALRPGETLSVTATAFAGRRSVTVDQILTGDAPSLR